MGLYDFEHFDRLWDQIFENARLMLEDAPTSAIEENEPTEANEND
jgi:hypothetical protein